MTRSTTFVLVTVVSVGLSTACRRAADAPKVEAPSLNVTSWTEKTELYMEHPPLIGGRTAVLAVHLTKLADF